MLSLLVYLLNLKLCKCIKFYANYTYKIPKVNNFVEKFMQIIKISAKKTPPSAVEIETNYR